MLVKLLAIFTLFFLSSVLSRAQGTETFRPSETNVWGAEYPRVDTAGKVQVRVNAPNATAVKLNFWSGPKLDMAKQPDGYWMVTTPPLVPGFHYYTLQIDGADVSDPNTHAYFGGGRPASGVEVPELGSTYYSAQDVPHGQVREVWYFSKVTVAGGGRSCTRRRNTTTSHPHVSRYFIYSTEPARTRRVGPARDARTLSSNSLAAGNCKPMIVVMAYGYAARAGQPFPDFMSKPWGSPAC